MRVELVRQTVITSAHLGRNVLTMATKKTAAERLRLGGHPRTRMMMHTDTDNRSKDRDHPRSSLTRTNTYDTETTRRLERLNERTRDGLANINNLLDEFPRTWIEEFCDWSDFGTPYEPEMRLRPQRCCNL